MVMMMMMMMMIIMMMTSVEPRYNYNEPLYNQVLDITIDFLCPSTCNGKYMKKNLGILKKPRHSEQLLPIP